MEIKLDRLKEIDRKMGKKDKIKKQKLQFLAKFVRIYYLLSCTGVKLWKINKCFKKTDSQSQCLRQIRRGMTKNDFSTYL